MSETNTLSTPEYGRTPTSDSHLFDILDGDFSSLKRHHNFLKVDVFLVVMFTQGVVLVGIEFDSLTTVIRTTFVLFLYSHTSNILHFGSKVKDCNSLGGNNLRGFYAQCGMDHTGGYFVTGVRSWGRAPVGAVKVSSEERGSYIH